MWVSLSYPLWTLMLYSTTSAASLRGCLALSGFQCFSWNHPSVSMPDEGSGTRSYLTEKAPNLRVFIYFFLHMQVSPPSGCPAAPIANVHYRSSHIPAAHPKYCQSSHYERCNRTTEKHLKSPGLGDLHHNIYSSQDHASKQNKTTKKPLLYHCLLQP